MAFEIGKIQTVVGTGEEGYAGDGGPATRALIGEAYGCDFDTEGNLYICDGRTHTIRRIDKDSGIITTVAGSGRQGYSGDGGPANEATLNNLYSLQVDENGDIYIVDRLNAAIRKVEAATGIITTVAGTGEPGYSGDGGPALAATWGAPKAIRCDHRDNVIVVDTENHAIRRIDAVTGIVSTIAGGHQGGDGDGGPATAAGLERPHGCGIDPQGHLYIADGMNHRVRVVGMG
jgi:sugar lactone lactonase YvrE